MTVLPRPPELRELSTTTAVQLAACGLRVAFKTDPDFAPLRRPTPRTLIGSAAHDLADLAWRGDYNPEEGQGVRVWLAGHWDRLIALREAELRQSWLPAVSPPATQWPGYALTRQRMLGQLERIASRNAKRAQEEGSRRSGIGGPAPPTLPWFEVTLHDPALQLVGRPDRVERYRSGVRVVDLKSGIRDRGMTPERLLQLTLYAHLVAQNGLPSPNMVAIEEANGRQTEVPITPDDIRRAVNGVERDRSTFNRSHHGQVLELAQPAPGVCAGCPYRAACGPFQRAWTEDWPVSRGVAGKLVDVSEHATGWEAQVKADSPGNLADAVVRVIHLPVKPDVSIGRISAIGTDVLGTPMTQRARWSTAYWPPLPRI